MRRTDGNEYRSEKDYGEANPYFEDLAALASKNLISKKFEYF